MDATRDLFGPGDSSQIRRWLNAAHLQLEIAENPDIPDEVRNAAAEIVFRCCVNACAAVPQIYHQDGYIADRLQP